MASTCQVWASAFSRPAAPLFTTSRSLVSIGVSLVLFGPDVLVCESRSPAAERFMSCVRESGKEHTASIAAGDCVLIPKVYDDETGARAAAAVALLRAKDQSR